MKKKKNTKCPKICNTCVNCVYIGEGDFICDIAEPVLVMEDFTPTDEFMLCQGSEYESEDDFYERTNKNRRKERNSIQS